MCGSGSKELQASRYRHSVAPWEGWDRDTGTVWHQGRAGIKAQAQWGTMGRAALQYLSMHDCDSMVTMVIERASLARAALQYLDMHGCDSMVTWHRPQHEREHEGMAGLWT